MSCTLQALEVVVLAAATAAAAAVAAAAVVVVAAATVFLGIQNPSALNGLPVHSGGEAGDLKLRASHKITRQGSSLRARKPGV